jgi:hypothetical protein
MKRANIRVNSLLEIERSYGPIVASLERRLRHYERKAWLQIVLTVLAFALLFGLYGGFSLAGAVLIGVASNVATTLGLNLLGVRFRPWRSTLKLPAVA